MSGGRCLNKITNLIKAITICIQGKNSPLNVTHSGSLSYWDCYDDEGWMRYKGARELIYLESRRLSNLLSRCKII